MTTLIWSSSEGMNNTTSLRAGGADINARLVSLGCVQTADTGQINWATVNYTATANTLYGYEVWRNPDSSIYFRILYYASNTATIPQIRVEAGTGSSGTGTLTNPTGVSFGALGGNTAPGGTPTNCYGCVTNDFVGLVFRVGSRSGTYCMFGFTIEKYVDELQAISGLGYAVRIVSMWSVAPAYAAMVWINPSYVASGGTTAYGLVPGVVTSSLVGSDYQIYPHIWAQPRTIFSAFTGVCVVSELPLGTVFSAIPVGTTPRTYISFGVAFGGGEPSGSANYGSYMLWE